MRRRSRAVILGVIVVLLLVVGAAAFEFVLTRGETPEIDAPGSIASLEKVRLGGVEQWILIRGRDRTKPVLLFLHGGPGMPAMYLAHAFQRALERDFVVVQWDRRGAGKSFAARSPSSGLTVSQTLEDTYELTRDLRARFAQQRIYLVGHSWGSYLGLLAVHGHPEFYRAFVGTGQLAGTREQVDTLQRAFVRRAAQASDDPEVRERVPDSSAGVSEDDLFRFGGELYQSTSFTPLLMTGLMAPEYTLQDVLNVRKGADLVGREMKYDVVPRPLEGEIEDVDVPVFFFLGRHDFNTPSQLAAEYLQRLHAPLKGIVWFEHSAHFPFFEEPERFHAEMVDVDKEVEELWNTAQEGGA